MGKQKIEMTKEQAVELKNTMVKETADLMQAEFEEEFADCLEEANLKLMAVYDEMSKDEELLKTVMFGDNRLELWAILMDNSVEDIIKHLKDKIEELKRIEKK